MKVIKEKKITVLGLGKTGYQTALFLRQKGARVFVSEGKVSEKAEAFSRELQAQGIEVELGKHSISRIRESDWIVVSPGISHQLPLMQELTEVREKWISEITLASWFCRGKIIAITGTNGKTTVTTLMERLLQKAGFFATKCGNIGTPFIEEVSKIPEDGFAVVELSSFQLYYSEGFSPFLAIVLNLAPDHFDWHVDFEEYAQSKMKLYRHQTMDGFALVNQGEPEILKRFRQGEATVMPFNAGKGNQNPNEDCLYQAASVLKISPEVVASVLSEFKGIEHRMERVSSGGELTFINDSKSTSLHSLAWALEKFEQKVILICGGKNKGLDFASLKELIHEKVRYVIALGEAKQEIAKAFSEIVSLSQVETLEEAVQLACCLGEQGEVVLFSPACASFDMFENYEDRGRQFKACVEKSVSCIPAKEAKGV